MYNGQVLWYSLPPIQLFGEIDQSMKSNFVVITNQFDYGITRFAVTVESI